MKNSIQLNSISSFELNLLMRTTKAIILDIDGTLVKDANILSPQIVDKLIKLMKKGYYIGFATGRTLIESKTILEQIKPNLPTICCNGNVIYDTNSEEFIYKNYIPKDICERIYKILNEEFYIVNESGDDIYVSDVNIKLIFSMSFNIDRKYIKIVKNNYIMPIQIYLRVKNNTNIISDEFIERLTITLGKDINIYRAGEKWLIINRLGTNKYEALKIMYNILKINLDNTAAFGNDINDVDLLKNVGLGIAINDSEIDMSNYGKVIVNNKREYNINNILNEFLLYHN